MPKNLRVTWPDWRMRTVRLSPDAPLCFAIADDTVVHRV
jgi:hypothetical protein